MEEKVTFSRQMAERMRNYNLTSAVTKYEDHATNLDQEVSIIRDLILNGFATKRAVAEIEEEQPESL
jgi:two-component system chemotaxis response regulator CheB